METCQKLEQKQLPIKLFDHLDPTKKKVVLDHVLKNASNKFKCIFNRNMRQIYDLYLYQEKWYLRIDSWNRFFPLFDFMKHYKTIQHVDILVLTNHQFYFLIPLKNLLHSSQNMKKEIKDSMIKKEEQSDTFDSLKKKKSIVPKGFQKKDALDVFVKMLDFVFSDIKCSRISYVKENTEIVDLNEKNVLDDLNESEMKNWKNPQMPLLERTKCYLEKVALKRNQDFVLLLHCEGLRPVKIPFILEPFVHGVHEFNNNYIINLAKLKFFADRIRNLIDNRDFYIDWILSFLSK